MNDIIIKNYTQEHKTDIINMILSIQQDEFHIPVTLTDQPDLNNIDTFYQSKGGNFWTAFYDSQLIGTIGLLDIGGHQGALRKLFVKAAFRGSKYNTAKLLLQRLTAWADKNDIQNIYLGTTEKFLAAHRFYEKNDFVEIEKKALPASFPVMKVDTKFYALLNYSSISSEDKICIK